MEMWKDCMLWLLLAAIFVKAQAGFVCEPENTGSQATERLYDNDILKKPCRRECREGTSVTRYYRLKIGNYQMMGKECQRCLTDEDACEAERCIYGDGVSMPLKLINQQLPGPAIEACQGDTLVADIFNFLQEPTTIHWHGIHHLKTPESDGVPFVTQYPIQPKTVHRVRFEVDEDGTEWYHSHMFWQRVEGVWAILIIRTTRKKDPHAHLYDCDDAKNALLLQDIGTRGVPRNILINGKGRSRLNEWPDNDERHRYHRNVCPEGKRIRIRVVFNGGANCPLEISIQDHPLLAIATDGNNMVPVWADKIHLAAAERFDVIVNCNNTPDVYWIKARGMNDCDGIVQLAILHYTSVSKNKFPSRPIADSSAASTAASPRKVIVNAIDGFSNIQAMVSADEKIITNINIPALRLQAVKPIACHPKAKRHTYYISFGFVVANNKAFPQVNNISYVPSPISLLQGRDLFSDDQQYCNRTSLLEAGIDCGTSLCQCTNVIRVPAFKCIELVVVNYMRTVHPFHLHGNTFNVIGQEVMGNLTALHNIKEIDEKGGLNRLPPEFPAVEKDTLIIPPLGYIIILFLSNNPGLWQLHCHIERHALEGMAATLKVGEYHQMKSVDTVSKSFGSHCG